MDEETTEAAVEPTTMIDRYLRLAMITGLTVLCGWIVWPFAGMVIWGALIAIAAHPLYGFLRDRVTRGRNTLAAALFGILAFAVVVAPVLTLAISAADSVRHGLDSLESGEVHVPPPPDYVNDWPLVGESLHAVWLSGSQDLEALLRDHASKIQSVTTWLLSGIGEIGLGIAQFLAAIVISTVLLAHSEDASAWGRRLARRAAGKRGNEFADAASDAIRSVTRGILGVAVIQALLCGLGFLAVDLPAAGAWAFGVLLLAIVQLPPNLLIVPLIAFVFHRDGVTVGTIFAVWSLLAGFSDTILKPLLLGAGSKTPMAVLFVGAIGGFMAMGMIGLFVGAVFLVVGHLILQTWLEEGDEPAAEAARAETPA